jgi:ATP adenylyltransferase
MEYIKQDKNGECIFCVFPRQNEDEKCNILHRGKTCFVIMNIYPYTNGHLMVSPYSQAELIEMTGMVQKSLEILRTVYSPEGFNIGINIGKSAGAGFDEHLHTHIVPRWQGDSNFMPVVGETKVHPEYTRTTYEKLRPLFQKLSS